jgi:acyl-CoA thioester hydrolase
MARVKIELPSQFSFSCTIPIRITDINYGGHLGNDTVLTIIHEARMQFLQSHGYKELELEGVGMIMADAAIEFKNEIFYGDQITVWVKAINFSRFGFDLMYKLEKSEAHSLLVAVAKTGMVCYDYSKKKITSLPEKAKQKLSA